MEREKQRTRSRKKKVLLVTHVSGFVPQFEMNNVRILQSMGYEVHYASNFNTPSYGTDNHRLDGTGIICHQIDFVRSPFDKRNLHDVSSGWLRWCAGKSFLWCTAIRRWEVSWLVRQHM